MATSNSKGFDNPATVADEIADPSINRYTSEDLPQEAEISPDEIDTWAQRLGIDEPLLRDAIFKRGPIVRDVKEYISQQR